MPAQTTLSDRELDAAVGELGNAARAVPAASWPGDVSGLDKPGLYAWWIDEEGAVCLSDGLGAAAHPGLIYVGQAGATKWPSGKLSGQTLLGRITSNHLRGTARSSTFRSTLAGILAEQLQLVRDPSAVRALTPSSEHSLSRWMHVHLRVSVHAFNDRGSLGQMERQVLLALDPQLNVAGMETTGLRSAVARARRSLFSDRSGSVGRTSPVNLTDPPPKNSSMLKVRVTLHEEIAEILRDVGNRWLTTDEIAQRVNTRARYTKCDGSTVSAFQIHGRTRNYSRLFDRNGQKVRLLIG